jgi:Leucine-rich repeat (LRR) protein
MRNNNNKLKAFVRFDGSGRVISSSLIVQAFKPKVGNWKEISAKECCNGAFDVTANWNLTTPAVTNAATFKTFLQSGTDGYGSPSNLTNVNVIDFSLINGRLRANLTATGTYLGLTGTSVSSVNSIGNISGLKTLDLTGNAITSVDQTIFPDSLTILNLSTNAIVTFNPSRPLPASLIELYLTSNQIITFNPTIALPSSLELLYLNSNKIVIFNPTLALPAGLTTLNLSVNKINIFNPTIALPTTISSLSLASNLMTTAGYIASEPWANAMTTIASRGTIVFTGNTNSVNPSALRTTLIAKGWTVTA